MDRRSFIKTLIGSIYTAAYVVFGTKRKTKEGYTKCPECGSSSYGYFATDYDSTPKLLCLDCGYSVYTANVSEEEKNWDRQYFDFSPDVIIDCCVFQNKLIVFCEHSIWACDFDKKGNFISKKISETIFRRVTCSK